MSPGAPPGSGIAASLAELFRERRFTELEQAARKELARDPENGFVWKALGVALAAQGQRDKALVAKRKSAVLLPNDAEAQGNLGNALMAEGRLAEARERFRAALTIDRRALNIWNSLAQVCQTLGRYGEAEACLRKVIELAPDSADAHNSLGNLLRERSRMKAARMSYLRALELRPAFAQALSNLGNTLSDLGQVEEAELRYREALAQPSCPAEVHSNLGNLLKEQGRLPEAQEAYRSALALQPDFIEAHSNLLLSMNHDAGLSAEACLAEARRYGESVMKRAGGPLAAPGNARREGPLRVGFVSGDLRNHPVGYFLEGVLGAIDPAQLQLFAYPTIAREDDLSARIKPRFAQWRSLAGLRDEAAARLIHADGIDVLLDLSGHTAYNRLGVFAWRPAPVQAGWLGYFATTGVPTIDWLLVDKASVPEGATSHFTEKLWYLPKTRLCFTPPQDAPAVSTLPALDKGFVTFGCFQNLGKINDQVLQLWAEVLHAVPDARLRLQNGQLGDAAVRARLVQQFEALSVAAARIEMHGKTSRSAYLAAHAEVDIVLDTFPYPGGTTTCEALWMGVPTLTLAGVNMLSRQGASLMAATGLENWIAADTSDYAQKSVKFARDRAGLADLRTTMRDTLSQAPLFNAKEFAADFQESLVRLSRANLLR